MKSINSLILCMLALTSGASAATYYMTPAGAVSPNPQNGTSWTNAYPRSQMATVLNTTMVPGDTLLLGSGAYGSQTISLTSSGTAALRKTISGVDTGGGLPVFESNNWVRSNPDGGHGTTLSPGGSYWTVENLILKEAQYAVRTSTANTGNILRNLHISWVRHGFYLSNSDNLRIENCSVKSYSKHGYRLDLGCDHVTFDNCLADMTDGDLTWWDFSETFPFGFIVNDSGASNTDVNFIDCAANNNRQNMQGDFDFPPVGNYPKKLPDGSFDGPVSPEDIDRDGDSIYEPQTYWNGDGFVSEGNTVGLSFIGCIALNNEDAGFDIKPAASFNDCVSVRNYRGFRLWNTTKSLDNCVATYPFRRSTGNTTGGEGGAGIWFQNGTSTADHFTFHGSAGTGVQDDGSGSSTLTDSILSFTGSGGTFKTGSVTTGSDTVTYRPGTGTDPSFVNPSPTWDGLENDMDSQTYGTAKGYNSGIVIIGDVISFRLGDAAHALAATDEVGFIPSQYWTNSNGANQTISNLSNNSGVATTADVVFANTLYAYVNNTAVLAAPLTDDAKMMRSQRGTTAASSMTATVTQVPYATYDIYVYWGGRSTQESVPATCGIELQQLSGGTYTATGLKYIRDTDRLWDGTYNESIATAAVDAVDGNEYVVFRNITTPEFRIRTIGGVRLGISGLQIVEK